MKDARRTQGNGDRRAVFLPKDDPDAAWSELQRLFFNHAEPVDTDGTDPADTAPDHDSQSS